MHVNRVLFMSCCVEQQTYNPLFNRLGKMASIFLKTMVVTGMSGDNPKSARTSRGRVTDGSSAGCKFEPVSCLPPIVTSDVAILVSTIITSKTEFIQKALSRSSLNQTTLLLPMDVLTYVRKLYFRYITLSWGEYHSCDD